eukprot:NODE_5400_length_585_cov_45.950943.p1 GENE.NODE_5400_length_585_cov_45.950943~~NODE_5400_length_585_cov_45.950943.p1  ORF type:complete len:149 (+),score=28.28 NODE_5400_length_585_cov_45.950943:37-447(+)
MLHTAMRGAPSAAAFGLDGVFVSILNQDFARGASEASAIEDAGARTAAHANGAVTNGTGTAQRPPFHAIKLRGCASWAVRQLDREVRRGAWTIHNITRELLFLTPPEGLYDVVSNLPRKGPRGNCVPAAARAVAPR